MVVNDENLFDVSNPKHQCDAVNQGNPCDNGAGCGKWIDDKCAPNNNKCTFLVSNILPRQYLLRISYRLTQTI